jgi:hypothetical protein
LKSTKTTNQKANAKLILPPADNNNNNNNNKLKKKKTIVEPEVVERLTSFAAGREVLPLSGEFVSAKVVHFAAWPKVSR